MLCHLCHYSSLVPSAAFVVLPSLSLHAGKVKGCLISHSVIEMGAYEYPLCTLNVDWGLLPIIMSEGVCLQLSDQHDRGKIK